MSEFQVRVRPARSDDVPGLVQLFEQLGYSTDEPTLRSQLEHFGRGGAYALVAELASHALAGVATVAVHPRLYTGAPSAQLTALVTRPPMRGPAAAPSPARRGRRRLRRGTSTSFGIGPQSSR